MCFELPTCLEPGSMPLEVKPLHETDYPPRSFVADEGAAAIPPMTSQSKHLVHGTYVDEHGGHHLAYLKIFGNALSCSIESQLIARTSERGVGPHLFEDSGANILNNGKTTLPSHNDFPPRAQAIVLEDVGIGLDQVLAGAPIPRRDAVARPSEIILSEQGRPFRLQMASKVLFDLACQLNVLHTGDEPIFHGDIKPANICIAAHGADARDIRATIIDFETADTKVSHAGARGATALYRDLAPGLRDNPAAYDLACMALVYQQVVTGEQLPASARFDPTRYDDPATSRIVHYWTSDHGSTWHVETHPERLGGLIDNLARELALGDIEATLDALPDPVEKAHVRKLVHSRRWIDKQDAATIAAGVSNLQQREINAAAPRDITVRIIADDASTPVRDELATFVADVSPDLEHSDLRVHLEPSLSFIDPSPTGSDAPEPDFTVLMLSSPSCLADTVPTWLPDAYAPNLHKSHLTASEHETPEHRCGRISKTIVCLPRQNRNAASFKQLAELLHKHPRLDLLEYETVADIEFRLFLSIGGMSLDTSRLIASVGHATINLTDLLLCAEALKSVDEERAAAEQALLEATRDLGEQPADAALAQRFVEAQTAWNVAEEHRSRQQDAVSRVLSALAGLLERHQETVVRERVEWVYRELSHGRIDHILSILGNASEGASIDNEQFAVYEATRRSADDQAEVWRERFTAEVVDTMLAAFTLRLKPWTSETESRYRTYLCAAARAENRPQARAVGIETDACETYAIYLSRESQGKNHIKRAREWFCRALEAYRNLEPTNRPVYRRREARVLLALALIEMKRPPTESHPDPYGMFMELIGILGSLKDDPVADEACRGMRDEAFSLDHVLALAYANLGVFLVQREDRALGYFYLDRAVDMRRRAINDSHGPERLAHALKNLGDAHLAANNLDGARDAFSEAIELLLASRDRFINRRSIAYGEQRLADVYNQLGELRLSLDHRLASLRERRKYCREHPGLGNRELSNTLVAAIGTYQALRREQDGTTPPPEAEEQELIDELLRRNPWRASVALGHQGHQSALRDSSKAVEAAISEAASLAAQHEGARALGYLRLAEERVRSLLDAALGDRIAADAEEAGHYAHLLYTVLAKQAEITTDDEACYGKACRMLEQTLATLQMHSQDQLQELDDVARGTVSLGVPPHVSSALLTLEAYAQHKLSLIRHSKRDTAGELEALDRCIAIRRELYQINRHVFAHSLATALSLKSEALRITDKHQAYRLCAEAVILERECYEAGTITSSALANRLSSAANIGSTCKEGRGQALEYAHEAIDLLEELASNDMAANGCALAAALKTYSSALLTRKKRIDPEAPSFIRRAIQVAQAAVEVLDAMHDAGLGNYREVLEGRSNALDQLAECLMATGERQNELRSWHLRRKAIDDQRALVRILQKGHAPTGRLMNRRAALAHQLKRLSDHLRASSNPFNKEKALPLVIEESAIWENLALIDPSRRRRAGYRANFAQALFVISKLEIERVEQGGDVAHALDAIQSCIHRAQAFNKRSEEPLDDVVEQLQARVNALAENRSSGTTSA